MYTLMLIFAIIAIVGGFILYGKLNWFQFTAIALVIALLIMFVPAVIQHSSITEGMELYEQKNNSKIYYNSIENKYYEISLKHGWIPWDLYDVQIIEKVTAVK